MTTSKLELPDVTLICLSGVGYETEKNVDALKKSCEKIEFGSVKYIQLGHVEDIESWNRAIIFDLPKYVETSHALLIHGDGYVINPDIWNPEWLSLDYIGAPWPLPQDSYSYRDEEGNIVRVGNSVSLRSKKLMELIATRPMEFHYGNNNEDGQICCWNRKWLEGQGCQFATLEQAVHFSKEHEIPENKDIATFAFHSL